MTRRKRKNLVVLSGAGISAESGITTFRGNGGLWEGRNVQEVASPQGWRMDKEMVLNFYNQRRRQLVTCEPNAGHHSLAELEADFDVTIITQNVDDLHERAGSTNVLHLHGELLKARSTADPSLVYELKGGQDILLGDKCTLGSQLRPHIVWFGEDVTAFPFAVSLSQLADIMVVVGTSLAVYPANTLIEYAPSHAPVFIVDPSKPDYAISRRVTHILEPATTGLPKLSARLRAEN